MFPRHSHACHFVTQRNRPLVFKVVKRTVPLTHRREIHALRAIHSFNVKRTVLATRPDKPESIGSALLCQLSYCKFGILFGKDVVIDDLRVFRILAQGVCDQRTVLGGQASERPIAAFLF